MRETTRLNPLVMEIAQQDLFVLLLDESSLDSQSGICKVFAHVVLVGKVRGGVGECLSVVFVRARQCLYPNGTLLNCRVSYLDFLGPHATRPLFDEALDALLALLGRVGANVALFGADELAVGPDAATP